MGAGYGTSGCYDLVLNGDRVTVFGLDGYALATYEYRR